MAKRRLRVKHAPVRLSTMIVKALFLAALAVTGEGEAQESKPDAPDSTSVRTPRPAFFYGSRPAGSDAVVGPLGLILNKGFQTAQVANRDRHIFDVPYGWEHVRNSLANGFTLTKRSSGLPREFWPINGDINDWDWWPNYFGHVLEGGIATRQVTEWYRAHGVPAPKLTGALTGWAAAVVNEAYEHGGVEEGWAGTALDLYLFDPMGILLFSHDGVARFFSQDLGATVWPRQASLTIPGWVLHNNGQDLIFKVPWSPLPSTSLFMRTGLGQHFGLTFHRGHGLDVSVGMGGEAATQYLEEQKESEAAGVAPSLGLFIDRGNALLTGVFITPLPERYVTVNVYPGAVPALGALGAWIVVGRNSLKFGISQTRAAGLGAGVVVGSDRR